MKKLVLLVMAFFVFSVGFAQEKKIAFVNVTEVLNKYQRKVDEEARFKKAEDEFAKDLKQRREEIEQLREELKSSDNEDDRAKIQWELVKATKAAEFFAEMHKERFQHEYVKVQLEMIKDVKKSISDYGEEKKYFLILQSEPQNIKYNNLQEAILQINLADVVYHDKAQEITGEIISRINLRYANKKANDERLKKDR